MTVTAKQALFDLRIKDEQIRDILRSSTDVNKLMHLLGTIAPTYNLEEYDYTSLYDKEYATSVIQKHVDNYEYIKDCVFSTSDVYDLYEYIRTLVDNKCYILDKDNKRLYYGYLYEFAGYRMNLYFYVLPKFFDSFGAKWFIIE